MTAPQNRLIEIMKKVSVDLGDLIMAFQDRTGYSEYYLDSDTGNIIMVTPDVEYEMQGLDLETITDQNQLKEEIKEKPDWIQEMISDAFWALTDKSGRFIQVENPYPYAGYSDMEAFIQEVTDFSLAKRLGVAIKGKGAFRLFKDALSDHPEARQAWFKFSDRRWQQRAVEWLRSHQIEPA